MLGVVVADPGALLGLGPALGRRACPSRGPSGGRASSRRSRSRAAARLHVGRALGERGAAPGLEGLVAPSRSRESDLGGRGLGVLADTLAVRGIDRLEGHQRPQRVKTSSTGVMRDRFRPMPSFSAPITLSSSSSAFGFSPSYLIGENASASERLLQPGRVLRDDHDRQVAAPTGASGWRVDLVDASASRAARACSA